MSTYLNRLRLVPVAAAVAALFLASACRSAPAPADAPVSPDTWAVVDGRAITRAEVEKAYRRGQQPSEVISEEETLANELSVLNDLIVQDLLLERARVLNLTVTDAEVENAYARARQNVTEEAYQQAMKQRNLTPEDVREGFRRELLAQKAIEHEVDAKVAVTDQEVSDFFNANREQFNLREEGYRVAQIAVTDVRDQQVANRTGNDATTPAAAAEKVKMLMERLKGGAPFGEVAMDFSEDPESAPRGGDMGLVPVSALNGLPPAVRNAVVKVTPGTVTVVDEGAIHRIVLMLGHEPAGQRDLSTPAVRENITANLRGRRQALLRAAYLTALRTDARVVNHLARQLVEASGKAPAAAAGERQKS